MTIMYRKLISLDSVVDAGELMFGRIGREVFAVIYCVCECTCFRPILADGQS
jgi:hypothetical protein